MPNTRFFTVFMAFFCLYNGLPAQSNLSTLDSINGWYIPKDLDDCLRTLNELMPDSSKAEFKAMSENEAGARSQMGLGFWMRENWGLDADSRLVGYFKNLGITHPEDMSSILVKSYHRLLTGQNIDLENQVRYFQEFWEEVAREQQLDQATIHKDSLESIAFLKKHNLKIRAFSKGGNEKHFECCYGFQVTKQILKNETVYWFPTYFYSEDVDETTDLDAFLATTNDNTFIDGLDDYGLIELAEAEPFRFRSSGDTLFQTVLKCHLSRDSIEHLYTLAGDNILTFAYCDSVLEAHSTPVDAVVFHKNLFKKSKKYTDPSGLTIHFVKSKTFDGEVYHRLYIDIPRPQGGYNPMEYVLNKNFNLINFENTPPEVCAWLFAEE